jgi:hypothetical protein
LPASLSGGWAASRRSTGLPSNKKDSVLLLSNLYAYVGLSKQ